MGGGGDVDPCWKSGLVLAIGVLAVLWERWCS